MKITRIGEETVSQETNGLSKEDKKTQAVAQSLFADFGKPRGSKGATVGSNRMFSVLGNVATVLNVFKGVEMLFPFQTGIKGGSFLGLMAVLFGSMRIGSNSDYLRAYKEAGRIASPEEIEIARAMYRENQFLGLRTFTSFASTLGFAVNDILQISVSHNSSLLFYMGTIGSLISGVLFGLYALVFIWRKIKGFVQLEKGNSIRAQLLQSNNPLFSLREMIDKEIDAQQASLSEENLKTLVEQEGKLWLKKLSKSARSLGLDNSFLQQANHKEYMDKVLLSNPSLEEKSFLNDVIPKGKISFIGYQIAARNKERQLKLEMRQLLGDEAMTAFENGDQESLKTILESANWKRWGAKWKNVLITTLGLIGILTTAGGFFLFGGAFLGVITMLYGVTGIIWIAMRDGALFMKQLKEQTMGKKDKVIFAISMLLNLITLVGLTTLMFFSAAIFPYLAPLTISLLWLLINLCMVRMMRNSSLEEEKNKTTRKEEMEAKLSFLKMLIPS